MPEPDPAACAADPKRLAALAAYDILDTPAETGFDDVAQLAALVCAAPVALVSLIGPDRLWFKAAVGFAASAVPLGVAICTHAVAAADLLVIPDLAADPRTRDNPYVTGAPGFRFYAGAPLRSPDGHALGSLCVLDTEPRPDGLAGPQADALRRLARQVMSLLELRAALRQREAVLVERQEAARRPAILSETQRAVAAAGADRERMLAALVSGAMRAVPRAEGGAVELGEGETLVYRAAQGALAPHEGLRVPLHGSLSGSCLISGEPVVLADTREDPRVNQALSAIIGQRACILVPVTREGRVFGVLRLQSARAHAFTPADLESARLFAGALSAGLAEAGEAAARAAAREGESRYRAVFDSPSDVAIAVTDTAGRVTDWNAGAERLTGWPAETMQGQSLARIFTDEDRRAGRAETEMRAALEEGRAENEGWRLRADGSRFWANGELRPLRDAQGAHRGFVKVVRDRSAEHRASLALGEAEAALRRAQEAGGVGVFSVDLADDMVQATPELCRLYGLPERARFPAAEIEALVLTEDAGIRSGAASRRTGAVARDVEYRIRRADTGELRWIARRADFEQDAEGRRIRFVGVVRDVTEKRLADEALRRTQDRYRMLFEAIEVGFCIVEMKFEGARPVDYRIAEANPAFARQTGADVVGRWVSEFAPDLERHWFDTYGRVALTGEPAHFENYAAVFGRWFDVRALRVGEPEARRVAIFFSDITARRTAEERALANERELRLIADALPVFIAFVDAGGTCRFANLACRDWLVLAPEAAVGRALSDLDGPVPRDELLAQAARALAGEPAVFEAEWPHPGGAGRVAEIRLLPRRDAGGRVDGFHLFAQDVTAHKRIEAELERQVAARTAERDTVWRASSDLLCVASLDGHFLSLNPAWPATLGWSEAEMKARPFLAFVHPDDAEATLKAAGGLARGEAQLTFENRYRHRDGSYRWLSWNAVPREGLIYASVRDITAIKAQGEALAQAEEALRQAQKMEAVGQLTGGLAHDFNNLLTGITGSLELMSARIAQGRYGDVDRYVAAAQGAAKRAAALTHRLLAFSRRQTLDPKPTDVNRLVRGMEDLVRRTVGPAVAVEVVEAGGLWPTLVDPHQLENALLNLCINARDAMPDGGHLTVETANRWLDPRGARERDLEPGQYVSLCVSDTGTGMSPDVMAKAFDPFFTTKPMGQGTGLGLSMIYGFVRQSGGQVRIYSELGQGTTMCLYLPRHRGAAEAPEDAPDPGAAPRARVGETVLIVDDEPTVRMLVTEVLEDLGYAAIEAADGASGLKVLQSDVRVDLLITDVGLPGGMNGRQMADAGRVSRPGLKVLFITGYAENAALGGGRLEPGMHVLTKPFSVDLLAARIRALIAGG
ncbi:Blue-light-activated protein [Methylobacterium dankookense]|uniref:histidine kinase n=1 Tax=Methylobacterium dankookense TaxID=560405 RepID=A0A564G6T3_9HYPH|nr:PAS domain S-box protein [Methylobacterium dankookense]GJD55400.1 Sensor histidine kinase RcsC [Methylobacterium dankookense]VUF15658.1 Blue-light-activated protein [Methylobacterium dankookense]